MKKFITRLAFFIPFCIAVYCIMICIWGELAPENLKQNLSTIKNNNTRIKLQEVNKYQNIDILFVGSSRAYSTFDVRIYERLGYRVFNLGTTSQTPIQTKVLMERYLKKMKPKIVIYEVSTRTFASDGIESAVDIVANGPLDYSSLLMTINLWHLRAINSFIYRSYAEISFSKPHTAGHFNEKGRTYIKGGYVEVNQMEYAPINRANNIHTTEINEKQIEAFEDIIRLLKESDIELVLIQVPFVEEVYKLYDNNRFNNLMAQYSEYYDYNLNKELIQLKYFRDKIHLNKLGVKEFNKCLIEQLNLKARTHNLVDSQ